MRVEQNLVLAQFALHGMSQKYFATGEINLEQFERAQDYLDAALAELFALRERKREGAEILRRTTRPDND